MSETSRQHKIIAEDAYKNGNFQNAINEYNAAIADYKCWPEGQYNLAMLLGETGYYDFAISRMKAYLILEPDAADAASSGDKIVIWQSKTGY